MLSCTREVAQRLLIDCKWNSNDAIAAFFDNPNKYLQPQDHGGAYAQDQAGAAPSFS